MWQKPKIPNKETIIYYLLNYFGLSVATATQCSEQKQLFTIS